MSKLEEGNDAPIIPATNRADGSCPAGTTGGTPTRALHGGTGTDPGNLLSVAFFPVRDAGGGIAHVQRRTRWYGGRTDLDTISADAYRAACEYASIGFLCDSLDAAAGVNCYTATYLDFGCCGDAGDCGAPGCGAA